MKRDEWTRTPSNELQSLPMEQRSNEPTTLFVFMDESGNMQFGPKASQHFILTAVCTPDPVTIAAPMQALKYDLIAKGSKDLEFHATNNTTGTRKRVIETINSIDPLHVHSIWIDKAYTAHNLQNEVSLFRLFGKAMGTWVHKTVARDYDRIVLIFDSVLTGKKRKAFESQLKPILKPLEKDIKICFHPVKQELNGQIADYYSWALYRKLESNDNSYFSELIGGKPRWDQFNMFKNGHTRYWQK